MDAWRNEDCIQLIQEYQLKPVLWNPKNEFYFSKIKKQDAWEEIGKNMKKNTEEIKKKALSLLGSFRREKAKGKKSMGTGKGTFYMLIILLYYFFNTLETRLTSLYDFKSIDGYQIFP